MNGISARSLGLSDRMIPSEIYQSEHGIRDESIHADGSVVAAWSEVFESYERNGSGVLKKWRETALRISRDRGLAYKPDRGEGSHWALDPIPWVFGPDEWDQIEKGISQKLRLSAAILADLYGNQRLLDQKIIPASIVLSHRGFLRALHDLPLSGTSARLGMSGFDIARGPGGVTYILNDRFDCPYGLGVALENRTVVNRVLPNLFRRCLVRKIGHFFQEWFEYLGSLAPRAAEQSRIVILDSSNIEENSEISFLANYCGITRVVPSDLTVRSAKVWLKSLTGLHPVDVIWKTTHGRDLDSLEAYRRNAKEGIAGIFEAIRESNVAVSGHPGAQVLESPGMFPFLAPVCRELLGEELILPPAATWWCGEKRARQKVLADLSKMVIKEVDGTPSARTLYGQKLSLRELDTLKRRIEANPENFVGQEELNLSTVPTSRLTGLVPRRAVGRVFAFLDGKGEPHVMPGGLGRVSTADGVIVSTHKSGESKDIWVRSLQPDPPISIAKRLEIARLTSEQVIPSRRGDNLYWAGRYGERTDSIARFANRLVVGRVSGFSYGRDLEVQHEKTLVDALFHLFECESWLENEPDPDARLNLVLKDPVCPVGIGLNLNGFHRACMAAREEWSVMSILAIKTAWGRWFSATKDLTVAFPYESALESLGLNLAAFHGLNLDSMTRDEAWGLLDAGCRIERVSILTSLLSRVLQSDSTEPMATLLNESVLFVSDSLGTYQTKYLALPETVLVLRLLLGEEDYPRSLRYLLGRLEMVLRKLKAPRKSIHPSDLVLTMIAELGDFLPRLDQTRELTPETRSSSLHYLATCQRQLKELHDCITTSYFSHAENQG